MHFLQGSKNKDRDSAATTTRKRGRDPKQEGSKGPGKKRKRGDGLKKKRW